ncbi:MAG: glycosyltransferase family 4 protein [Bryobacteraceae bacterium]|nr:glycosyltransferase family 4 protein [Bryobacteraceae bacterium]
MLLVIETHPVQYHAPVYRAVEQHHGIPVTVLYGSDFSVRGYADQEFSTFFAWDTDLLGGYTPRFLSEVSRGGAGSYETVDGAGLEAALRGLRPGAVLLPGYSGRMYRRALLATRRMGCPLLFRAETADHAVQRGPLKRAVRDGALRLLYRRFARLLFIGERSRRHYERLGCPEEKLVFSPYCVDTTPFRGGEDCRESERSAGRAELGVDETRTVVLLPAKISYRKGPDLLVEAARRLPLEVRDRLVLVFLGDGELRERLAGEAAALGVEARWPGFRNQSQLSRYYHAADLTALPSRHGETWGLVVNESLHHGVPCVVSDAVGCAPDLIQPGETGEVFEAGGAEALARALDRALGWIGGREVRESCRRRVEGFSVAAAAAGVARAYGQVT